MIRILAIPGSLRANSSSNAILNEINSIAPANVALEIYRGVGTLPHFNDSDEVAAPVIEFRNKVRNADAILICTPEYAFGVPGSLKNAIDWTVSSGEFVNKPVGLITASSQGEKGHAALLLILSAISARIIDEATLLISFVRSTLDDMGNVKDPDVKSNLNQALQSLTRSVEVK